MAMSAPRGTEINGNLQGKMKGKKRLLSEK